MKSLDNLIITTRITGSWSHNLPNEKNISAMLSDFILQIQIKIFNYSSMVIEYYFFYLIQDK